MTKAEFLRHLDKRLQILKQNEREDILGEYAQHIELKMENGLSEEEAIRDFGDLDELADEILDAYHVNSEFGKEEKHTARVNMEKLGGKAGVFGRKTADGMKSAVRAAGRFICSVAAALKHGCFVLIHWLPFGDRVMTEDGERVKERKPLLEAFRQKREERESGVQERRGRDMWSKICGGSRAVGRWLWRLVSLYFRLCVLLFLMIPVAIGDCLVLVGLGGLLVLVAQGYPLIGLTIMTFGALASGVAFVWFMWDLMFRKRRKEETQVWESGQN